MTDKPNREPLPQELFLILDVAPEVSQARLRAAGKDLTEEYHREASLLHYRERFRDLAQRLAGAHLLDSSGTPEETLGRALQVLMK